jgi:hypothetical protein
LEGRWSKAVPEARAATDFRVIAPTETASAAVLEVKEETLGLKNVVASLEMRTELLELPERWASRSREQRV